MTERSKALYDLFKTEKKHEDRTKQTLEDLEQNSASFQRAKVQLVEKLLDVAVKDEISKLVQAEDVSSLRHLAELSTRFSRRHHSKQRIHDEIAANVTKARNEYPDGFVSKLDQLLQLSNSDARGDVSSMVAKYLDPHIAAYQKKKKTRAEQETLASIDIACQRVATAKKHEAATERNVRARRDADDRAKRVTAASAMFKKNIGDLGALLFVSPTEYNTDIGRREAEINDLRRTILSQRAEEERLLQERQIQMNLIDGNHAKLAADVEQLQQRLNLLRRELDTKGIELNEMQEASRAGGSGAWANNTIQLEKDLSLATEEEYRLRQQSEQLRHSGDALQSERGALDDEITDAIAELKVAQQEHSSVLERLEGRLSSTRETILGYRNEEQRMTKEINDLRHRMIHRREDIRRQKRALREKMNTVIGQLSIEDHSQSLLMARSLELQKQIDKIHAQADHHVASLQSQTMKVNGDLTTKGEQIRNYAVELANYFAGSMYVKEIKLTPVQLQTQIDAAQKEADRLEKDAADQVAAMASRIDNNLRENALTLKQMGWFAILQEDVQAEGVDIAETAVEDLMRQREALYSELTQRSYREGKYTQCIRLLRDRLGRRQRGEAIEPLTLVRRVPLSERRARQEVFDRSKQAKEAAKDHLKRHQLQHLTERSVAVQDPLTAEGRSANAASLSAFRALVISHIKKEIQPLYDNNLISKARFVDVVHRVSTWYLENHHPVVELSQHNMTGLNRKIQEILTWQDEQRLSMRGGGGGGPAAR
jgi:hypothetical protein